MPALGDDHETAVVYLEVAIACEQARARIDVQALEQEDRRGDARERQRVLKRELKALEKLLEEARSAHDDS